MADKIVPRVNDDLILYYNLRDPSGQYILFDGAIVTVSMVRPDGSTVEADTVTFPDLETHNLQANFSSGKMDQVGWHRVQVEIEFNDGTSRHSEIDRFYVADNLV